MAVLLVKSPAASGARIIELLALTILDFDATTQESHNHKVNWTSHPVESGIDVTDNAVIQPDELTLNCVISNTPLGLSLPIPDKALSGYETLLRLKDSKRLVTVVTGLRVYTNMGITNVSVPRAQGDGQKLRFTVNFKEIRKVVSVEIEIPPELLKPKVKAGGQSPVDAGTQPTAAVEAGSEEAAGVDVFQSKAAKLFDKWAQ